MGGDSSFKKEWSWNWEPNACKGMNRVNIGERHCQKNGCEELNKLASKLRVK